MKNFLQKYQQHLLVFSLTTVFIYIAFSYIKYDSLTVYDAPGHLGLIWYIKNYLWPAFSGWNSFSLLGFDQGRFYPPLFHYLAAFFSFFLGLESGTKLVIAGSLIALPLSSYYFVSNIFRDIREKVLVSGIVLLSLVILPGFLGADIKALFQVGLLPSFVSTPLVLFYLGSILRIKKIGFILPTLLLSAVILTHLVAGFVALIFLLVTILVHKINKEAIKSYLVHLVTALLLTIFFWLPFVINSAYLSSSVHLSSYGAVNIVCFIVSLALVFYQLKKRNQVLLTIAAVALLLSSLTSLDYLVERFLNKGFVFDKLYSLHFYRFQIYQYLLIIILVLHNPVTWLYSTIGKKKSRLYFIALTPIIATLVIFVLRPPLLAKDVRIGIFNSDQIKGRFIEAFSRESSYPFIYTGQNDLVMKNKVPWAYGLFTDASTNGSYLSSLVRSFDPEGYSPPKTNLVEEKVIDKARLADILNLFAIDQALLINFSVMQRSDGLDLFSFKQPEKKLVEQTKLKLETVRNDWNQTVDKWWISSGRLANLLVYDPKNDFNTDKNLQASKVEIVNHSNTWDKFEINVSGSQKVPVLIKFSYSPNWKAVSAGKEVTIYRASPNLMLISASGKIVFQYQTLWYQYFANVLSVVTLFWLGVIFIKKAEK